MDRIYDIIIDNHFNRYEQMLFLSGPRRVGKTTIAMHCKKLTENFHYLNWDIQEHKKLIINDLSKLAEFLNLNTLHTKKSIVVFDEIHKFSKWKNFLKGFFDAYKDRVTIIVTGSSKLNIFKKGGDSLMGRYFHYRIHPFSIAELVHPKITKYETHPPKLLDNQSFDTLFEFGGFPEPFIKKDKQFFNRWKNARQEQLFREDIRDLTRIQELGQLEILATIIKEQAGQLCSFTNLANKIQVTIDTIKRWLKTLNSFYYCFTVKPWSKNITRSLLKEPKIYLWDWSDISDIGAKAENFVACHLLKAVQFWTDFGFGNYDLYFLRDKEKREVDFVVTKNNTPWFLVEVKYGDGQSLSKNLAIFQTQTKAAHAFQVVFDMPPSAIDCFKHNKPIIVPAQTFLSQLI